MITEKLANDAVGYALAEIQRYALPTQLHFDLSLRKAEEIADKLGANVNLAIAGAALMDIKLGEAFQQGRLPEHVKVGIAAAIDFLKQYELDAEELSRIINCIEAHHGAVPHSCVESEIVTNADCYRFLHPVGVLSYIGTLSKRNPDLASVVNGAEAKLEEKHQLVSLDICKQDLDQYYKSFKEIFAATRLGLAEIQRSRSEAK